MGVEDLDVRIRYFCEATDEHLQLIGVDRSKLDLLEVWRSSFAENLTRPMAERTDYGLIWEADDEPIGFSTADRIVFGGPGLHASASGACRGSEQGLRH